MRSVLLLAHRFPPLGGAAVQRNLQVAHYLIQAGYRPVVVTGPGARDDRWTPRDNALIDTRLPAPVHRVRDEEPDIWPPRLHRWLRLPSQWERWWTRAVVPRAMEVGAQADIIHASLAPFAAADAAISVARLLRKPLVLDLEDPWALDDMLFCPTRMHRRLERRLMRRVLTVADFVIMNTAEARLRVLSAFPELNPERVVAVPNAFDPRNFADPQPERRRDGRFRIVHTGTMHTDLGLSQRARGRLRRLLGGVVEDVDYMPRSHVYLLEAVARAVRARPELAAVIEVHLAGVFTPEDRAVASRYDFVRLHEFLPHEQTLALMRSADLLFLPLYDLPMGRRAGIIPHKTYEYIGSRRPILAAVPDGDARDLLGESGAAVLCRPSDTAAMTQAIVLDVEHWASGLPPRCPRPDVVARCSSARLVADLAAVYDAVVGASPRLRQAPAPSERHVRAEAPLT